MPDNVQPLHMWSYWRGRSGVIGAVEDYYPGIIAQRPDLAAAVYNAKFALAYLEREMEKLSDADLGPDVE